MLTPQATTPPTPPAAPAHPASGLADFIKEQVGNGLAVAQSALEEELPTAIANRNAIQAQLDVATSTRERASLNVQLIKANQKIADIQRGIAKLKAGENKVGGPSFPGGTAPPLQNPAEFVPTTMIVSVMAILFIGFPLAITFSRILLRRATNNPPQNQTQLSVEQTRRFDQLEQAVDSIAIEIERISEGQRYLTKVLSEPRAAGSVAPGPPKPMA